MMDPLARVIQHHTLMGTFTLSHGAESDTYVDLREAVLCSMCRGSLLRYYLVEINKLAQEDPVTVIATGSFGALLIGSLASLLGSDIDSYALWNPKAHGREWSGRTGDHARAVLVDDVVTTGGTLEALRAATARLLTSGGQAVKVLGEVVAMRRTA